MDFVECKHCGHMIPEDEIACINCENETGFHDEQQPIDQIIDGRFDAIIDFSVKSNFAKDSEEVKNAHLSFVGDADTPIDTKSICSFFTEILGIRKQPGTKYMPKPGNAAWRKPMLEVITKHGVYITYAEAKWVSHHFQNKEVLVWTENSSRDGWLWIHEARNFTEDQKVLCEGCCDADIDQLSPF